MRNAYSLKIAGLRIPHNACQTLKPKITQIYESFKIILTFAAV